MNRYWSTALWISLAISIAMVPGTAQAIPFQLCFDPVTTNADGTVMTDFGYYRIDYGNSKGIYTQNKNIGKPVAVNGQICYPFTSLVGVNQDRLYYARVVAIDSAGNLSIPSREVSFNPRPICEYNRTSTIVKDPVTGAVTEKDIVYTPTKVCP